MSQHYNDGGEAANNYLIPTPGFGYNNPGPDAQPLLQSQENNSRNDSTSSLPKAKTFRQSWWRWLMLFFGCCFLLGSYFCYDNPGPIEKTMEDDLKISTV